MLWRLLHRRGNPRTGSARHPRLCRSHKGKSWMPALGDVIQLALTHRKRNDRRNIMLEWYQAEYRFVRTASCAWFCHMLHIRTTSTNWITTPFAGHDGGSGRRPRARQRFRRRISYQLDIQITPLWVGLVDQTNLPRSWPLLDIGLTLNCHDDFLIPLHVDEPRQSVSMREFARAGSMFV